MLLQAPSTSSPFVISAVYHPKQDGRPPGKPASQAGKRCLRARSVASSYPAGATNAARSLLPTWSIHSDLDQLSETASRITTPGAPHQPWLIESTECHSHLQPAESSSSVPVRPHIPFTLASTSSSALLNIPRQLPYPGHESVVSHVHQCQPRSHHHRRQGKPLAVLDPGTACAQLPSPASVLAPTDLSWGSQTTSGEHLLSASNSRQQCQKPLNRLMLPHQLATDEKKWIPSMLLHSQAGSMGPGRHEFQESYHDSSRCVASDS